MTQAARIPLRPDPDALRTRGADAFTRVVAAFLLARSRPDYFPKDVLGEHWPNDLIAGELLQRSVSSPASIGGWGNTLAATALADFVASMGPASAGASLLPLGQQYTFDGDAKIVVPGIVSAAANASFVQQGAPYPVRELSISADVELVPRKFGVITTFRREIVNHSVPNLLTMARTTYTESIALAFDAAIFGDAAADASQPAGLLNGVAAETASVLTPASEAMLADVQTLASAVAPIAGNHPIVFIAAPAQAVALRLFAQRVGYQVLSSGALADRTVIAVASNALASAFDPTPRFEASDQAVLHMDTAPTQLSGNATATPVAMAYPMRSMFQEDSIALKTTLKVAWALRNAGGIAWIDGDTAW